MFKRFQALAVVLFIWTVSGVSFNGQSNGGTTPKPGVTIAGSVVDASLAPIAGAAVTLERDARVVARTVTDAAGLFRFGAVDPGNYRVRAEHTGFPAFVRDVRVPSGVTAIQVPIVLARAEDALQKASATPSLASPAAGPVAAPSVTVAGESPASGRGGGARVGGVVVDRLFVPSEPPIPPRGPGERYAHVDANRFQSTRTQPLSTFGADVDTASYSNVRRFLSGGQLPPPDAVRVEELVNYFRFAYDEPTGNRALRLTSEIGDCPWAPSHKLVLIGARAKAPAAREITARNLVLLIDVSGSMAPADRLPLLRTALGMFVDTLRPDDRLAIVTYAGSSGVALPSTPASQRDVIQRAIANLSAGGSTNGGQGLITAYRVAREAFVPGGVNRVILATDGDFNVGIVGHDDLLQLIEREKNSGVFLSVFGVGTGNLKDSTMEMLADKGNGHYAYLDSLQEARRVLLQEGDATLETVAKDVKFQVEFNPAVVSAWKLVGYENRLLAPRDFNDDRKDGGEMGAGHTVTVLYEVIPAGVPLSDDDPVTSRPEVDPLKYQRPAQVVRPAIIDAGRSGEWLTVKARFKAPESDQSDMISLAVRPNSRTQHLPMASAVAEFGLLLQAGSTDGARWDRLVDRVERLSVPPSLISDKDAFKELVSIARGLSRLRQNGRVELR